MANLQLQSRIGEAVRAAYAGSTIVHDDVIFSTFCNWCEGKYGVALVLNVPHFNSDTCRLHRVECVSGFLASAHVDGYGRNAGALFHALRRIFTLHSVLTDAFAPGGTASNVVRGAAVLRPPRPRPKTVGATHAMVVRARLDVECQHVDPPSMLRRMLGLSALYAYAVGARVSEIAATRVSVAGGHEINKHTVLRSMVRVSPSSIEVFPASSKTTGPSKRRPNVLVFFRGDCEALQSEEGINALLCVEIARFLAEAKGLPEDPLFSFRHGLFRKCLTRDMLSAYTKDLGSSCGLHPDWCSTKSWKVGRVSHGVETGAPEAELLARGNHRSATANRHYRPWGRPVECVPAVAGISTELALDEIRRDRTRLGLASSSDSESDA